MKNLKRRSFLTVLGVNALIGYVPWLQAEEGEVSRDVEFIKRDHKFFDLHRRLFNKRLELRPKIFALCKTELGVQKAIHYANDHDLRVSVKSGGHSFEGFSLNNDGMVIDASQMSQLALDKHHQLVAEPAVKLAQLYSYCLPKGRLLPSGSCGSVGLSGITLGGGYGLFARQFGLTCDYLTGVRMVDATGNVLDSDDFSELLWACRGAGNGNFGVVTQLRFNTVAAPETLYQHRFRSYKLNPKTAASLAQFWFEQCDGLPNHAFSAFVLNGRTLTVMLTATEHDQKMIEILNGFEARMDKNDDLKPDPLERGVQYYYGRRSSLYFKNLSAGYYRNFSDIEQCAETLFERVANTPGAVFQINTLGGEINDPARSSAGAYAHRDARYLGEAQCYYDKPEDGPRSMAAMKYIQDTLSSNGVTQHYVNYPDVNIHNHEAAYYGDSIARLQKLKRALDPENLFKYEQGITPS